MTNIFPAVWQAVAGENYTVCAYMNDGTVRLYDAKPLIEKGGVFGALRDKELFEKRLTVLNDTIAWDLSGNRDPADCIDVDPFTVADCPDVTENFKKLSRRETF